MEKTFDSTILDKAAQGGRTAYCRDNNLCFISLQPLPANPLYSSPTGWGACINSRFRENVMGFAIRFGGSSSQSMLDSALVKSKKNHGSKSELHYVVQYGPGDSVFCIPGPDTKSSVLIKEFKKSDLVITELVPVPFGDEDMGLEDIEDPEEPADEEIEEDDEF